MGRAAGRGSDLSVLAHAALDRRLNPDSPAPLALAASGGGDSVALLVLTAAWAERVGRTLVVLTVDHGLQPESADWCEQVTDLAGRFGADAKVLHWTGAKPATGLPAAARRARHALLADAARQAGACVILTGHTADDVLEGERMRAEGSTLGRLRDWTPSPAWPEGRGVFLLRPLLEVGRAELRAWLLDHGLSWIEDPANADPRSARARARIALAGSPVKTGRSGIPDLVPDKPDEKSGLAGVQTTADGRIVIGRERLASPEGRRIVAASLACASGTAGRLRAQRLDSLLTTLRADNPFIATLGGARVTADDQTVIFAREPGETARGGLHAVALPRGSDAVWDGRYQLVSSVEGLIVQALKGFAAALPAAERSALSAFPAAARPALPVVVGPEGVTCPLLAPGPVTCRSLVGERLRAALGGVLREA